MNSAMRTATLMMKTGGSERMQGQRAATLSIHHFHSRKEQRHQASRRVHNNAFERWEVSENE